ncbi:MAG: MASE1 domain-containing protein [Candidatus Methylomirabilales bacterium]
MPPGAWPSPDSPPAPAEGAWSSAPGLGRKHSRRWDLALGLTLLYILAAKLGLSFAFLHPSATPIWPPTGIALAALLLLGPAAWPVVFAGAFTAQNNFQMLSDLLYLQAGSLQSREAQRSLRDTCGRLLAIARLHEQLYQSLGSGEIPGS